MKKLQVYHFHNGGGGGVLSVIKNLLFFSDRDIIDNHIIHAINKTTIPQYTIEHIDGAVSQQLYYYTPGNNFYHTCRQLAKLLPGDEAIIIAHDWIELGMMSNLGLQNLLVFYLHGDYEYYYRLAENHESAIDLFIPVAQNIELKLKRLLINRTGDIAYLRFPVPSIAFKKNETTGNIIFIGRLETEKGYALLPVIAKKIQGKNINLQWHIVGAGKAQLNDDAKWHENINVKFYGDILNAEVLKLLAGMQILVLPSLHEGMPVVLVEAMKCGVIPVVNDIDGGIQELVFNNETGYKIKDNQVNDYVEKICKIVDDKTIADQMQHNCVTLANHLFDPVKNTKAFEDKLENMFTASRKKKHSHKVYGSRLDEPWIPNRLVQLMRKKNF